MEPPGRPGRPARLAARIWHQGGRPAVAAIAASAAGLIFIEVVVLVVWGADTGSPAGPAAALRVGADVWLVAHGATLKLPAGVIAVRPLGLAVFPLAAALSAAHRRASAARTAPAGVPWRAVGVDVVGVVAAQTVFVLAVALVVGTRAVRPQPWSAVLGTLALGLPAALLGALAGRHRLRTAWRRLPVMVRVPVLSGMAACSTLVATAAFGVAVVLAATLPEIAGAERSLDAGVLGGLGLAAAQLALLPNMVLWGLCYALGPGFRIGPGLVRPDVVHSAHPPDLPIFAALPPSALPRPGWLVLALVPIVAGAVLAAATHRATPDRPARARLVAVLGGAVVCGVLVGLVAQISIGQTAAGARGAAHYGPASGWLPGLVAGAEVAAVGLLLLGGVELAVRRAGQPFVVEDPEASLWRRLLAPSGAWTVRTSRRGS